MSLDDYNYYNDARSRAGRARKWYDSFDESTMTAEVTVGGDDDEEVVEIMPAKFEVCGLCDGTGSHVNPSIDSGGLSSDDFYDDPDFADDYSSGRYDVQCYECGGKRVTPVIDLGRLNDRQKWALAELEQQAQDDAEYEALVASEIRYGC
jgi:hypothetical protein